MEKKGLSVFQSGLIWFGAALSIAEIEIGAQMAPPPGSGALPKIVLAIVLGHLLGGFLLFLAGLVGAKGSVSSMNAVKQPFGKPGAGFFAALNLAQLIGWTAVMIASGAVATEELLGCFLSGEAASLKAPVTFGLGALVAVWIFVGLGGGMLINKVAMALLFLLSAFASFKLLAMPAAASPAAPEGQALSFWAAMELSVAMPLSWLPLISDYTGKARRPVAASAVSASVYTAVSVWMYLLGIAVAANAGTQSFAKGLIQAGVGAAGLFVVVFSTSTTTFLDAYSAGESAKSIFSALSARTVGLAVCLLGTLLAYFAGMDHYLDFLYLIASVFAPMAAVWLVDYFVVRGIAKRSGSVPVNFAAWISGFLLYHLALGGGTMLFRILPFLSPLGFDSPLGATLPAMALSAAVAASGAFAFVPAKTR